MLTLFQKSYDINLHQFQLPIELPSPIEQINSIHNSTPVQIEHPLLEIMMSKISKYMKSKKLPQPAFNEYFVEIIVDNDDDI